MELTTRKPTSDRKINIVSSSIVKLKKRESGVSSMLVDIWCGVGSHPAR